MWMGHTVGTRACLLLSICTCTPICVPYLQLVFCRVCRIAPNLNSIKAPFPAPPLLPVASTRRITTNISKDTATMTIYFLPSLESILSVYYVSAALPTPILAHRPKADSAHSTEDPLIVNMRERGSLIIDIRAPTQRHPPCLPVAMLTLLNICAHFPNSFFPSVPNISGLHTKAFTAPLTPLIRYPMSTLTLFMYWRQCE